MLGDLGGVVIGFGVYLLFFFFCYGWLCNLWLNFFFGFLCLDGGLLSWL